MLSIQHENSQGGHKPGKYVKPGKLRELKMVKISGKTQGSLNFYKIKSGKPRENVKCP